MLEERLKLERQQKGLTQKQLGQLVGVSAVAICGYEGGTKEPSLKTFHRLVEVLNTSSDYLLGRDEWVISDEEEPYHYKFSREAISFLQEVQKDPHFRQLIDRDYKRLVEQMKRKITL